jgi:hypothetical protein
MKTDDKCLVKGCINRRDQGSFVGDLCYPCYHMLTTGQYNFSKAWFVQDIKQFENMYSEVTEKNSNLQKENTRLFELFKIQSDQNAAHIKGLNESLDAKREVYMKEIDRLKDQLVIANTTQENLHEEINKLRSELDACGKCVKRADEEIAQLRLQAIQASYSWGEDCRMKDEEIDRLRGHKIVDEAVSMQVVIELRKEVEELKYIIRDYERYEEEITKWKNEGEALVESAKRWPFKFANWWADRPWRK